MSIAIDQADDQPSVNMGECAVFRDPAHISNGVPPVAAGTNADFPSILQSRACVNRLLWFNDKFGQGMQSALAISPDQLSNAQARGPRHHQLDPGREWFGNDPLWDRTRVGQTVPRHLFQSNQDYVNEAADPAGRTPTGMRQCRRRWRVKSDCAS